MEPIANQLANEKNRLNEAQTGGHLPTSLSGSVSQNEPKQPDEVYLATVLRMVLKSISLANSPTLTEEEQGDRTRDWAEVLYPIIPDENEARAAFQRAVHAHRGSFPLTCYEVIDAFRATAEEAAAQPKAIATDAELEEKRLRCLMCFGTGLEGKFDIDGKRIGTTGNQCTHEGQLDSDKLFAKPNVVSIDQEQRS